MAPVSCVPTAGIILSNAFRRAAARTIPRGQVLVGRFDAPTPGSDQQPAAESPAARCGRADSRRAFRRDLLPGPAGTTGQTNDLGDVLVQLWLAGQAAPTGGRGLDERGGAILLPVGGAIWVSRLWKRPKTSFQFPALPARPSRGSGPGPPAAAWLPIKRASIAGKRLVPKAAEMSAATLR